MTAGLGGPWAGTPAVRLRRWYQASAGDVFRAFTEPHLLRQWWKPRGFVVEALDFSARTGASYRVRLRAPDGTPFEHIGTILEVDAPNRLVYSWRWIEGPLDGAETLVELSFIADGGGVIVDLCHSRFANQAECDKHVGWQHAFDELAMWLSERGGAPAPGAAATS